MKNLELEGLGVIEMEESQSKEINGGGKISYYLGIIVGNTIEAITYVGTKIGEGIEASGYNHAGANK